MNDAIFINYRRDDSAPYAGRLYDFLSSKFPNHTVFMDIDSIEPGDDFIDKVNRTLESSRIVLAVIGRNWLTVVDETAIGRLDNPDDYVVLELSAALSSKARVIPVLVAGASMPRSDELPTSLALLARRHAVEMSDIRFRSDADLLAAAISKVFDASPKLAAAKPEKKPKPPPQASTPSLPPVSESRHAPWINKPPFGLDRDAILRGVRTIAPIFWAPYSPDQLHSKVREAVLRAREAEKRAEAAAEKARAIAGEAETTSFKFDALFDSLALPPNLLNRPGIWRGVNGDKYAGGLIGNTPLGVGVYTYANSDKEDDPTLRYEGEVKHGMPEGVGMYFNQSGGKFFGSFVAGVRDGYGVYRHANGNRFEGQYRQRMCDGHGAYWDKDGRIIEAGVFVDGKLVTALK